MTPLKSSAVAPPISPRPLPLMLGAIYLANGLLLRIFLWATFGREAGLTASSLPAILATGLGRDLPIALGLCLPLVIYLDTLPRAWLRRDRQRHWLAAFCFLAVFPLLYLDAVEFYFFEEFQSRLDLVAVDYLIYPTEVFGDIWESYPVLPVLLGSLALTALILRGLWPAVGRTLAGAAAGRQLRQPLLFLSAAGASLFLTAMTADQPGPAAENRVADQLAENGIRTFLLALATSEIDYRAYYRSGDTDALRASLLARLDPATAAQASPGIWQRRFAPAPDVPMRRPNIVLILQESFGAEFVGAYGDSRGLTPRFDELAGRGLLFRHAYATGTRTVRGIEGVLTSLPPIPTVSIVRRPGCEGVANIGSVLRGFGYRTVFHYGGFSYFDNMRHFFESNGYEVHDRDDLPSPAFANIWGVSDEDLFRGALAHFDRLADGSQPFFGVVLTTSNHKPFTFPADVPGVPANGGGRLAGVRYADYAMGRFFDQLAGRAWAADTLFVVVADHGARVYGAAQIPLKSYEIPLLFYWPGRIEPGLYQGPVSQIDIAPTLLGRLGRTYDAPFFGRDVLRPDGGTALPVLEPRPALLPFNHNHDVGLLVGDRLTILGLKKSVDTYLYGGGDDYRPTPPDPELVDLTTALYQTADDLFHRRVYR